jgi:predicted nucleic acid-binding protein
VLLVADSSALITLAACDALDLLERLFDRVRVPKVVRHEVVVPGKPFAVELQEFLRGKAEEVNLQHFVIAAGGLGQGELEAMALVRLLNADLLLIDDRRARAVAEINEIKSVGSLGILVLAKRKGLISKIRPYIDRIQASQIYLGPDVVAEVLRAADEA